MHDEKTFNTPYETDDDVRFVAGEPLPQKLNVVATAENDTNDNMTANRIIIRWYRACGFPAYGFSPCVLAIVNDIPVDARSTSVPM